MIFLKDLLHFYFFNNNKNDVNNYFLYDKYE